MCGGYTCNKNTLVVINICYILVSFILIGVAVHGKVSGMVTSLPIIGGITACGIFLLIIAIVGFIGAIKHHQVTLFVYMIVLFVIFVIQFSVSCAALGVNIEDEKKIVELGWKTVDNSTKLNAETFFNCCGLKNSTAEGEKCAALPIPCAKTNSCAPCMDKIQEKIDTAFNAAGGLGLFFSFTELIGGIITWRYRNQMDPLAENSGAPFAGSM